MSFSCGRNIRFADVSSISTTRNVGKSYIPCIRKRHGPTRTIRFYKHFYGLYKPPYKHYFHLTFSAIMFNENMVFIITN